LLTLAFGLGAVIYAFYSVSKLLPVGTNVADIAPTEATKIYSSDGVLLANIFHENREFAPITDIPKNLQDATVAIEDKRFYKHEGIDFIGIGRSLYQDIRKMHKSQGGSTLTQQLARNIYLTHEKKLSRKLQEIALAYQLERNYSKEQILEMYLNQVFYGSGSYGVETASKVYFGKDVKDLSLSECALIAGLPQRPTGYSPYSNMKAAINRRDVVLKCMYDLHYITESQYNDAKEQKIKLVGLQRGGISKYKAPWFVNYVLDELADRYKYDEDMIYKGGLRIYTTLNYGMQQAAEEELRKGVSDAKSRRVSQGALVCIDPHTGYIKAMVGSVSPDFTKDQYNRAVQARRQPGSAFKAFVYTAAIDNGYDPNYRLSNARVTYPGYGPHGWSPKNFDGRYGGKYSIKQAVAYSVNTCAVAMAQKVGINKVIDYARRLGIKSPLTPNLSLALGSCGVCPLELCSAYGVFAADGVRAEPLAVVRITGSHSNQDIDILLDNKPDLHQVLSEETAASMNEIFRGVVTMRRATGASARGVPNAHGKTGTTTDDRDAWFVGYTPELVTAVWVGNDDYRKPMKDVWGGNVCAPTWARFMLRALKLREKEDVSNQKAGAVESSSNGDAKSKETVRRTKRIRICAQSGLLATKYCPATYVTTISADAKSPKYCNIHTAPADSDAVKQPTEVSEPKVANPPPVGHPASDYVEVTICVDSGQIANKYCPQTYPKRFLKGEQPRKICQIHKAPE